MEKFKRPCEHNNKQFSCKKVTMFDMVKARSQLYQTPEKAVQDQRLCHFMSVGEPKRKRPRASTPTDKARPRGIHVTYFMKTVKGSVQVCQKFITSALGVSKNRLNTVAKILDKGEIPKERRGGDRKSAKSATKKRNVNNFIGSLKGHESHYSRSKSKRIYLTSDLNISRLHKMYNRTVEHDKALRVTFSMFRRIFVHDFNVGFRTPSSDCCTTCVRLQHQIHSAKYSTSKNSLLMQLRVHKLRANAFYELAKQSPPSSYSMCFDLQQVQPLPRTPIQEAFYSRQIGFYSLCCVPMDSKKPEFYVWTEDQAGRGSTEVSSALLHCLNHYLPENISRVRLFCDGCGGQNKNNHVIHALAQWLRHTAPKNIQEVLVVFPVRGHSFLPADRVFGRVEKLLRKRPLITTKEEYEAVYSEVGNVNVLGKDWILHDVKSLSNVFHNVRGISDCKRIFIGKHETNTSRVVMRVRAMTHYKFDSETESAVSILKRGKVIPEVMPEIPLVHDISVQKKNDVKSLLCKQFGEAWHEEENLQWYKDILDSRDGQTDKQNVSDDELCSCVGEDERHVHV